MTATPTQTLLPPRLSMEDYIAWLDQPFLRPTPEQARRQKALEERIAVPFQIPNLAGGTEEG